MCTTHVCMYGVYCPQGIYFPSFSPASSAMPTPPLSTSSHLRTPVKGPGGHKVLFEATGHGFSYVRLSQAPPDLQSKDRCARHTHVSARGHLHATFSRHAVHVPGAYLSSRRTAVGNWCRALRRVPFFEGPPAYAWKNQQTKTEAAQRTRLHL